MVDAVVSFVVARVGDYLIREAAFLGEVRSEVHLLKNELQWMQCFIEDAEEKEVDDLLVRQWVSDITAIAYDTEDVLDEFLLKVVDHHGPDSPTKPGGFLSSIKMCACLLDKGKEQSNLYNIGKEIECLRKRISDLYRKRETYGLENIGNRRDATSNSLDRLKQLRRATSFAVEENVVGFEDDANKLLAKLLGGEAHRLVISIYGMGGLGKTTLARKLYHNSDVKSKFDFCAWVSISQDYTIEDLLVRIITSFNVLNKDTLEKMRGEDLERCLHRSLQRHSYLLVIDDVWKKEVWESLKRAFPDSKNGSRVIVTSRIKEVAERSDERTHFHELRFLRPDESWMLFCEKAFRNSGADDGLERLGREMVHKCGGLPLAIVVLGGLLSTKKLHEWRSVRDHIWRHLRADSIQISYLLDLSFNDLSYQLKLCFLYLSLFPEDYEINMDKLTRLMVGEGFIEENEERLMEDVAKDNLTELINRSLIQIGKVSWGKVATCRVHDLVRDLGIQKAKKLNFIKISDEVRNRIPYSSISSCRRQAVYSETSSCLWLENGNIFSRSLLLVNFKWIDRLRIEQQLRLLFTKFFLLRVFDVEASGYVGSAIFRKNSLPGEVGKLIHLRYMGLRNSRIDHLPSTIGNLKRLQTLELADSALYTYLPNDISKLKELRHLIGNFRGLLPIENLSNLQTLKYVLTESWSGINPVKLISLRELRMKDQRVTTELFSFNSIAKLKSLRILSIQLKAVDSFASLQPLSECRCLVDLRLTGKIEQLPEDLHDILPNLECLRLKSTHLSDDPMPVLEKMTNLMILDLHYNCYEGKKLMCTAKGFPRLEILQLLVEELEEWQVEEGAMPRLRGLKIPEEFKLRIPERLRSIPPPAKWDCQDI